MGATGLKRYESRHCPKDMPGAWTMLHHAPNGVVRITGLEEDKEYIVEVRCVPVIGMPSDWVRYEHTITGPAGVPPVPENLTTVGGADQVLVSCTMPPRFAADVEIEFEWAPDVSGAPGAWRILERVHGTSAKDSYTDGTIHWYRARAVDYQGAASVWTAPVSGTAKTVADGADVTADNMAGRGTNVCHPRYSIFSEQSLPSMLTNCTVERDTTYFVHGSGSLKITTTTAEMSDYVYLGASSTDYNVPVIAGKKYIFSGWVWPNSADAGMNYLMQIKWDDGTSTYSSTLTAASGANRVVFGVFTVPAGVSACVLLVRPNRPTVASGKVIRFDGIMLEEQVGTLTTPSVFVAPGGAAGTTAIAADSGQVADQRSLTGLVGGNQSPAILSNDRVLTGSDAVGSATISVDAHTRQYAGGTISLNSGSVTGLSHSTKYYVYYDDQFFQGGSVTYAASTSSQTVAANKNRFYVGACTTPAVGGGSTSGGTVDCLALDMVLDGGIAVRDVERGYSLEAMNDDAQFVGKRELVWKGKTKTLPCVEIVTASASVICTHETPVICDRPGGALPAVAVEGQMVMTKVNGVNRWERVLQVKDAGEHEIVRMSFGGVSFPGGKEAAALIYTHNGEQKP